MAWYLWFISGLVGGLGLAFGLIIAGSYVVMHSTKLQQRFISRTMGHMMKGAVPVSNQSK